MEDQRLADRIFYALLTLGLVGVVVAFASSCGTPAVRYASPYALESEKQRSAAVMVRMTCATVDQYGAIDIDQWRGSGVITSKHTVLTANHVADCPTGLYSMTVQALGGEPVDALVSVQAQDHDIAELTTVEVLPWFHFDIGPKPTKGDIVCSEGAVPTRARKCGIAGEGAEVPSSRDIHFDLEVEGGNSGSGLFDSKGRLVGIVTMQYTMGGRIIGGRAASLWVHRGVVSH